MHRSSVRSSLAVFLVCAVVLTTRSSAQDPRRDFGSFVQDQLAAHAEQLFGFSHPLAHSALGPYDGPDNLQAIQVARWSAAYRSCRARSHRRRTRSRSGPTTNIRRTCSSATRRRACPPCSASTCRVRPTQRHDDRHRALTRATRFGEPPWGTIIVAEEAGATGGLYEIIDPAHITTADQRDQSRHRHEQRSAASGEAAGGRQPVVRELRDRAGRHDDLRRRTGAERRQRGRRHLQVRAGDSVRGRRARSRFRRSRRSRPAPSTGLRVAASKSSNWGQGAETGKGAWVAGQPERAPTSSTLSGNIILRTRRRCSDSPATTGRKTWTSIRSPPRTACSGRAGPTPAARATPTAASSRTARSRAKSCA